MTNGLKKVLGWGGAALACGAAATAVALPGGGPSPAEQSAQATSTLCALHHGHIPTPRMLDQASGVAAKWKTFECGGQAVRVPHKEIAKLQVYNKIYDIDYDTGVPTAH